MIKSMLCALGFIIVWYVSALVYSNTVVRNCAYDGEFKLLNDAVIQCNVRVPARQY